MKKTILLLLLVTIFISANVFAQRKYRVKTGANQSYIVPPYVSLRFKCNKEMKKKFTYFYVRLTDLNGKYENDMVRLSESASWNGKIDEVKAEIESVSSCDCSNNTGNKFFKWNFLNNRGGIFLLQVNFDQLNTDNVNENYRLMMTSLINSLAVLEANSSCTCAKKIKFAEGFSQQLVKKLKERIPVPIDLPQPGSCFTAVEDQSYFMLLDQDITLKVDTVKKIEIPDSNDTKFRYEWLGYKYISFKRSSDGSIKQNSFASFDSGLPNNAIKMSNDKPERYNLASLTDLVSSEALNGIRYLALFHPPLKRNTNMGKKPSSGMYNPAADTNPLEGNTFLLHIRSNELTTLDFTQLFGDADGLTKSFFSGRGSIQPMIKIYLNGVDQMEDFDSTTSAVDSLPRKFRLHRKYGDEYRKVRGPKNKLILLPNDHLTYKL
jgi:hypothetical protein